MADINYSELSAIIIDDQEFVRTIVSKMLMQIGFKTVSTAVDGETGFDSVMANKPDVIICDIVMKPVGGLAFLERFRREGGEAAQTPVIFMTGDLDQETVVKAHELGVDALLMKPVPPKKLREKIDILLMKQRAGKDGKEDEDG